MKYPRTAAGYAEYIKSAHWDMLRSCVLERDGHKCVRCGSRHRLQAHHKFYRADWEEAQPEDCETLCKSCHEKEHPEKFGKTTVVRTEIRITTQVTQVESPFSSWKQLRRARSRKEISRAEYLKWVGILKPKRKPKRKHRAAKVNRRQGVVPWHYNPVYRSQWVNRGTTSN